MRTIKNVREECAALGIPCSWHREAGEFCIGASTPGTGYWTNDAQDAVDTARLMAAQGMGN